MAWSFSVLGIVDRPFFTAIASAAIKNIQFGDAQAISMTAWSFASLGIMNAPLMQAIEAAALPKLQ
jgi:hypothetical protein